MNTIKTLVEQGFHAFVMAHAAEHAVLRNVDVLCGHRAEKRRLPCVVVSAERAQEREEFPSGCGVYDVGLKVFVLTQADDEDFAAHDGRVAAVQSILGAWSTESIPSLHLYDLISGPMDEGRDERHFGEVLNYTAVCQKV